MGVNPMTSVLVHQAGLPFGFAQDRLSRSLRAATLRSVALDADVAER